KPAYVFAATSPEEVFERIDLDTMIPEHKEILRVDGTEIEKLSSGLRYSQDEIKMLETMQVDNEHLDHPAFPNLMVDVYDDVNQLKANKAVFSTSPVSDKLGQYDVSLLFVLDAEKPQLSSVVGQIVKHPEFGDTNPPEVLCEAWAVCSVSKESVYLPVWTQDEQVSVKAAAWAVVESLSRQAEQQLGFDFSVSGYKTSKDCLREEYAESIYEVMDWVTAHYEKSDTGLEPLPHPSQLEEVAHGVFRWQNESEYFEISAHDEIWVGKTNLASQNANIPNTSVANTFGQAYAKLVETCSRQLDESSPMLRIANPAAPDSSYDSVYSLVEAEGLIEPTRDERFLPGFKPAPHSPRTPLSDIKPVVFRPKTDGR
ncbi:MAG: hypothetical protein IJZ18_01550, partial [Mailhella sp.]|nr:hypothetical protein [Mailhella sp.]